MTDTAFASAFAKQGIHPRDAAFNIAIAKYINSGGTWAEGRRLYDAAERMSGMGHPLIAQKRQEANAQTRQPLEGGEATSPLPQGHPSTASPPSFNRGGEGQPAIARHGHAFHAPPVREPTVQQRMISARNARVVAITIMDTLKVDGRTMREWGVAEAERAGHAKTRDGYILRAAAKSARSAHHHLKGYEKLSDLVPESIFERIKQKAEEVADAV